MERPSTGPAGPTEAMSPNHPSLQTDPRATGAWKPSQALTRFIQVPIRALPSGLLWTILAVVGAVFLSGCAGSEMLADGTAPLAHVRFEVYETPPAAPNCQESAANGGVQTAGGPSIGFVTASTQSGQLFADCNLVAVRTSPYGKWTVRHLQLDLAAATVLAGGKVLGFGYQFYGGSLRFLTVTGSVRGGNWTFAPLRGTPLLPTIRSAAIAMARCVSPTRKAPTYGPRCAQQEAWGSRGHPPVPANCPSSSTAKVPAGPA